jgi:hypothetical protein
MKYRVEQQPESFMGTTYEGYIDDEYAGYVTGREQYNGVFYITDSALVPKFRGTKAVRAVKEILKGVMVDYNSVMTRKDSSKNEPIKILLSAGFHIVGTVFYQGEIAVELLKTKEPYLIKENA